jgi:hypothetical protein
MSTRTLRKISGLAAVAAAALAISVPSATAVKPEGVGGGKAKANAARACKAERADIGVDAFREKYGTNSNKKNAMGKCVASKRKQAQQEEPAAV